MRLLFYDMRIPELLADKGDSTGGACVRQNAISKGLVSLGHQVGILTWKGANAYVGKKVDVTLVESLARPSRIGRFKQLKALTFNVVNLYLAAKPFKPDYLFMKTFSIHTGAMALVSKLLNIPFVYLVANDKDADDRYKKNQSFWVVKSYQFALSTAKLIVCQNSYQYEQFKRQFPQKKMLLMSNPFYYEGELPQIRGYSQRKYIAWVGVFSNQKNLPLLLDIARRLPQFDFKIAGNTNSPSKEVSTAVSGLKELDNVEFVGYVQRKEILSFLLDAYLLLNTSRFEGFSNTFLESFAAGTPVVAKENVDPDYMIREQRLGGSVAEDHKFSDAIVSIINDPNYDQLAQRCREHLLSNHNTIRLTRMLAEKVATING